MTEPGDNRDPEHSLLSRIRRLYQRRPVIAWGGTAIVAGALVAAGVVLAVDDGSETANVAIHCSVSNSNGGVVLTIEGRVTQGEADSGCDELAAKMSGLGSYWRIGLPSVPSSYPEIMCGLDAPAGRSGSAIVEYDSAGSSYEATSICGTLAHEGWTQFTQGGVVGPWQHAYTVEEEAVEEAEAAEAKLREEEQLEAEAVEGAIVRCEQQAETVEAEEIAGIQEVMRERRSEASSEEGEYEIEEESWAEEEGVWQRTEAREERCRETGGGAAAGETEYR